MIFNIELNSHFLITELAILKYLFLVCCSDWINVDTEAITEKSWTSPSIKACQNIQRVLRIHRTHCFFVFNTRF